MATKIPRHYSGTWTGKVDRSTAPKAPKAPKEPQVHHKDMHPNASTNMMSDDAKVKMYNEGVGG